MVMHGFDPLNGMIKDFTDFCERLERTIDDNKVLPEKKKKQVNFKDCLGEKPKICKGGRTNNIKFYCLLHGPNRSHNSDDCTHLKRDAEKHKKSKDYKGKRVPKKVNRYGEEVHTLLEFATKVMNDAKVEKRRKTKHELNNFEHLKVSDSETNL